MNTPTTATGYARITAQRATLLETLDVVRDGVAELEMSDTLEPLDKLRERLSGDAFKVLVLGEFRRGKSTVINALLGARVLPAFAVPTTATINEVKWGEPARAVLHPTAVNGTRPAPREIPVDELAEHVVVGEDDDAENPYERVEVFWPLALCRDGVEIIDSPGLNDRTTRERVTTNYLACVDAVLFVVAADMAMAKSEVSVIERLLHPSGHDHLFFLVNRINLIETHERDDVREVSLRRSAGLTEFGRDGVFFLDARGALQARIADDAEAFALTGFADFERALEEFLSRDRGAVKLLAPAKELERVAGTALSRWLPRRHQLLDEELGTLEEKREAAGQRLRSLELERDLIVQRVQTHIESLRGDVVQSAEAVLQDLAGRFPEWAASLETDSKLSVFAGSPKAQADGLAREAAEQIEERCEAEMAVWCQDVLEPLIAERQERLLAELDERARAFLAHADEVRVDIVSGSTAAPIELDHRNVSAAERVLAAGGGFLVGGAGGAVIGASGGLTALMKGMLPQIALAVAGLYVLGPGLALLALLTGGGLINRVMQLDKAAGQIKGRVAEALADRVRTTAYERAAEIGDVVADALGQVRDAAGAGLSHEITQIREELDAAIQAKREGEDAVEARRLALTNLQPRLTAAREVLTEMIVDLTPVPR